LLALAPLAIVNALSVSEVLAHPSMGIVVTAEGRVFFAEAGNPERRTPGNLRQVSADGTVTSLERGGHHWLALDAMGAFSHADLETGRPRPGAPFLKWTRIPGGQAGLIQADGMPLVVHGDGNLYYGNLEITRLAPDGKTTLMVPKLAQLTHKLGGIKGLASGPGNTLVATCPGAILHIALEGSGSALVHPVSLEDCGKQPTDQLVEPGLRGLAVDDQGTVYAAATSAGCVIKVTSDGMVRRIMESESPWLPTGVAVHGSAVYVLEYWHGSNPDNPHEWRPRVRRVDQNGNVVTLYTAAKRTGDAARSNRPSLIPAPGSPVAIAGGALAAGDVNGDAFADLVLVAGKRLNIFFGGADRTWQKEPDVDVDLAADASEMVLADLNQDGKRDVVIADHDSYTVSVLLGRGDGRFVPAEGSPLVAREGNQPHTHGLAVADVNGDTHFDIVTANNNDGDLSLLLGDGKGKFIRAPRSPFSCGKRPYPIAASDINGDGYADVLVPNAVPDSEVKTLTVLLGTSRGDLAPAPFSPLVCDATVWYAATGDLNGDKRPDIVATHSEGFSGATILLNAGEGKFVAAPGSPLEFGHGAWCVEIADMDRDGNADLVVAAGESIRVLHGDGSGRFTSAAGSPYKTGKGAWRLVVADVNGDGRPDVATRCVEANQLEIFLGN
jgi:hypothetical protein